MNHSKSVFLACALAFCATQVFAGPLAVDVTAMPGFHGTVNYANGFGLIGTVDYAVWSPGTFPGAFGGFAAPAGDYVYTYQANETGIANLSQVTITLTGPVDAIPNIGDFSGNNGFGPVAGFASIAATIIPFDNANWLFDAVSAGTSTDGLAFSSPNGPIWAVGRTTDDGTNAFFVPVPSPNPNVVPEPGTLMLASCGFAVLILQWLRRRGRKTTPFFE